MAIASESFISSIDEMRRHLRIAPDDREHDARLEACINSAAQIMRVYTGRRLKDETYTDKYLTGDGSPLLSLPEFPLDPTYTITVRVSTNREWSAETDLVFWNGNSGEDAANAEVVVASEDAAILERTNGDVWPEITKSIRISYKAGYQSTDSRYHALVEAQILLANWLWGNEGVSQLLASNKGPGITATFVGAGMPTRAVELMRPFVRLVAQC